MEDKITNLEAMQNVDVRTVDPDTLVDISSVKINTDLPKEERIRDFINQIKNPYCFKCGNVIVKTSFIDTTDTLEDKLESYLRTLQE